MKKYFDQTLVSRLCSVLLTGAVAALMWAVLEALASSIVGGGGAGLLLQIFYRKNLPGSY